MNRIICLVLSAILSAACLSAPVSSEDARLIADDFVRSNNPMDDDKSVVTGMVSRIIEGEVAYYIALREKGGAIIVSSDTRELPIKSIVSNFRMTDKSDGCSHSHFLERVDCNATNSLNEIREVDKFILKSGSMGKTSLELEMEKNQSKWDSILSRSVLKSSDKVSFSRTTQYIIPGFESGGKYTHWNQCNAKTGFTGTKPCYNFYMCSLAKGGSNTDGLRMNVSSYDTVPCGCTATAMSAASQCMGMGGIRQNPTYRVSSISLPVADVDGQTVKNNVAPIPGPYNWEILPSNYGGSAPEVHSESSFTDEMRELLGRVAYNFGLAVKMDYGIGGSGSYPSDIAGYLDAADPQLGMYLCADTTDSYGWYWERWNRTWGNFPTNRVMASIYSNIPLVISIFGLGGHCVNIVGCYVDNDGRLWGRIFMGWSGNNDSWTPISSNFSISGYTDLRDIIFTTGSNDMAYPIYGDSYKTNSSGMIVPLEVTVNEPMRGTTRTVMPNADGTFGLFASCRAQSQSSVEPFDIIVSNQYGKVKTYNLRMKARGSVFYPNIDEEYLSSLPLNLYSDTPPVPPPQGSVYDFSTPEDISSAISVALAKNKKVLVVVENSESFGDVNQALMNNRGFVTNNFVVMLVDSSKETRKDYLDCLPAYGVFDPSEFEVTNFWKATNGRLSYGTFTNEVDMLHILNLGL